MELQRLRIE